MHFAAKQLLTNRLAVLERQGLKRTLRLPRGIDLSSNDYLGFAADVTLQKKFLQRLGEGGAHGAAGSRLLRGNLALYEETEQLLADFVGRQAALLFSSGYAANVGLMSALLTEADVVFSDALNHASIIDGIRLSKAQKNIYPHRNYAVLEQQLQHHTAQSGLKVIVTESVFSIEGSIADLLILADLAERYGALLIVDEAHSTGLWGASLVAKLGLTQRVFASIHPAGKALGASGAWIAGDFLLKEYLVHTARAFIFSTAPIPALAILLQETIKHYAAIGEGRASVVLTRARHLRNLLAMPLCESPIVSIPIGDNQAALAISLRLCQRGWDVRAIRPPTVPINKACLRVTVKWANSESMLEQFVTDFRQCENEKTI